MLFIGGIPREFVSQGLEYARVYTYRKRTGKSSRRAGVFQPARTRQISLANQMFGSTFSIVFSVETKKFAQTLPHGQTAEAYFR